MSFENVDLQFIVTPLLHEVSKKKGSESTKNATLLNKTHKANEKLYFYCKKPEHFVKNSLKKKNDEKEKVNQAYEDQEQMFVASLGDNDHMTYDWIIDSDVTQHMTFKQEWFTTFESIIPWKVYMGDDSILEAISKGSIMVIMRVGGKLLLQPSLKFFMFPK
jgi:hypothetical protein